MEQVARRGCGVSNFGGVQKLYEHGLGQLVVGGPA